MAEVEPFVYSDKLIGEKTIKCASHQRSSDKTDKISVKLSTQAANFNSLISPFYELSE